MAKETQNEETKPSANLEVKKNKLPLIIIGVIVIVALGIIGVIIQGKMKTKELIAEKYVPYQVAESMYQLKDGAYLRLGFSITVGESKLDTLKGIIESDNPSALPDGLNILLGNKSRDDLINGAHKREAFAQEIKKILEERVLQDYNKQQKSPQDMIEIRKVYIYTFVTQTG
ncbi:MAG: hypothetical protein K0S74_1796 [Chlamydiales bacterium]|jgi:flagellar basal body-associated protein FliL|nr:hypothetical protein [Chlamydiales bacterium]